MCSFGFYIGAVYPLIYDTQHKIYNDYGITFAAISHLESLGLVHFDNLAPYLLQRLGQKGIVHYFGEAVCVELPNPENNILQLGHVLLTTAGQQLAPICGAEPRDGFIDYVKERWKTLGYKTEPSTEQSSEADGIPASAKP